ncbi:MAG: prepilin-type N-terminal cleavage/methylation domain-containing protein [Candidatus Wildermuthbacteria bacterium]|nr:prepilin-type N-terminal cleavage/methylation domain-containing protein [Candidatus Wildermuthbacteria bacterium]
MAETIKQNRAASQGFTLMELLVVVVIIGILAGVVVLGLKTMRERGRVGGLKEVSSAFDSVLRTDLRAEWKFDEGSGSTALDTSGNNQNGTLGGTGASCNTINCTSGNGNCPTYYEDNAKNSFALEFDGTNDYVVLPSSAIDRQKGTVTMWIKRGFATWGASGTSIGVFRMRSNPQSERWSVTLKNESGNVRRLQMTWRTGIVGGGANIFTSVGNWQTGEWHFVAMTWDASMNDGKIYVDGVSNSQKEGIIPIDPIDSCLRLGGYADIMFKGAIDDLKIYGKILTAGEIQSLYAQTAPKYHLATQ